jgi:hypothetical protein
MNEVITAQDQDAAILREARDKDPCVAPGPASRPGAGHSAARRSWHEMPAAQVRRPRIGYQSHATGLDRSDVGARPVAAGPLTPDEPALVWLLNKSIRLNAPQNLPNRSRILRPCPILVAATPPGAHHQTSSSAHRSAPHITNHAAGRLRTGVHGPCHPFGQPDTRLVLPPQRLRPRAGVLG